MNRLRTFIILTTTGLFALFPGELLAQGETIESEAVKTKIREVHAGLRQAAEALDADALYAHVLDTPTPPVIENGRLAQTRSDALRNTAQGLRGIDRLSYTYVTEDITVLSPNTVLWVGTGSAAATLQDGREISSPFAETIVFVNRGDEWKVLHAHRSAPGN